MLSIQSTASFSETAVLSNPLDIQGIPFAPVYMENFDPRGYSLTRLEKLFHRANGLEGSRTEWFTHQQEPLVAQSYLLERKGYAGLAMRQLQTWARDSSEYYSLLNLLPRWGMEIRIYRGDTVIFNYFYDTANYTEALRVKTLVENRFFNADWINAVWEICMNDSMDDPDKHLSIRRRLELP